MNSTASPQVVLPSYMGHLLYTPCTLGVDRSQTVAVNVDIADHFSKDYGNIPVQTLLRTETNLFRVLSYRGCYGLVVQSDGTTISIDTPLGRRKVTLQQYLERAEMDNFGAVIIMADEVSLDVGHNRRRKAFQRNSSWVEQSLQTIHSKESMRTMKIFAVTMADPLDSQVLSSTTLSLLHKGVHGIVVGGVFMGESVEARQAIFSEVRSVLNNFNQDRGSSDRSSVLMMVQGADSIDNIFESLKAGVDLIHTNYPLLLTKKGFAFYPSFLKENSTGEHKHPAQTEKANESSDPDDHTQANKRQKTTETGIFALSSLKGRVDTGDDEEEGGDQPEKGESALKPDWSSLNLWDEEYIRDRRPLMEGCTCLACSKHTRAYIHHLLKSKELLAEILLYQHNQFQVQTLFESARVESVEQLIASVEDWKKTNLSVC